MSPELFATLLKWLVSDDPVERAHAEWRLAQPDQLQSNPRPVAKAIVFAPKPCGACPDHV